MSPAALNLWVFRDGRRYVSGQQLKNALLESLAALSGRRSQEDILRALLRAGEFESAIADAGLCTTELEKLTDLLAEALLERQPFPSFHKDLLESCEVPETLSTSVPEGFAYYVLHPLAYADVVEALRLSRRIVVIGIRSIGSTLSAVISAEAGKRGRQALRMTVRPQGHPYNRKTTFALQQREIIRRGMADGADFLVVDEGPGLSGSSFLSVAEALLGEGVAAEAITLICSHQPDFDSFRADDGPRRARRFRWLAVHSIPRRPENAQVYIGGGEWRRSHFADESNWPPSWTNLERSKYVSPVPAAERRLFKFLGLGHYGDEVFERERQVAMHGFAPMPQREAHGFASYAWLNGRPMRPHDLTGTVLLRLAEYCAFRAQAFAAELTDLNSLQRMADYNLEQMELHFSVALHLERPVIADGRMQPHEWLLSPQGRILKVDSGSHGDDHFFPGPTDIAWDLAGSIVEWQMDAEQADFFLASYRRISGDDARERVKEFVTAYSTFRKAYLLMAANALHGSEEQARLERAAASYELGLKAEVQTTGL